MKPDNTSHLSFPFRIGANGRTACAETVEQHVQEELIQLLLTDPGERAFLVEFGGGVEKMVFENNDPAAAGLAKAVITRAITQWLGHRIELTDLKLISEMETVILEVSYRIPGNIQIRTLRFESSGGNDESD